MDVWTPTDRGGKNKVYANPETIKRPIIASTIETIPRPSAMPEASSRSSTMRGSAISMIDARLVAEPMIEVV